MVDVPLLLAFVAAAALLTATPGVDTAIVLRTSLIMGRRAAMMASIGVAIGCVVWGGAVALGLGALLKASELAYEVLKYVGAAYLVFLGLKMFIAPRSEMTLSEMPLAKQGAKESFMHGLWANLLNPKVGVFYVTFLPQFVPTGSGVVMYTFFLACVHVMLTLGWFALLIIATSSIGEKLRTPSVAKFLDRIAGGVLLAFGFKLANSSS